MGVKNIKKTCSKCGATLPVGEFHKNKSKKGGVNGWCRKCVSEYRPLKPRSEFEIIIDGKKKCSKCCDLLPVGEFHKKRGASSGLESWCKQCKAEYKKTPEAKEKDRQYQIKNREKIKAQKNSPEARAMRRLRDAKPENIEKRIRAAALPEARAKKKKYNVGRMARPGVRDRKNKLAMERYAGLDKQVLKKHWDEYNARPEVKIRVAKYYRERKQADPKFKLNSITSTAIYQSLKRRGGGKNGCHWESLVGYTVDDLKKHLEKQFIGGMSWDNHGHGGWHIDHIIPISKWNFASPDHDDFNKCWALKNLQPMWGYENIVKGASLEKPFQPSLQLAVT